MSFIDDARGELKRADHQIFVSLKYTRTADVLRNIIERFVACYDYLIEGFLVKAEQEGKVDSIPASPVVRVKDVRRLYEDSILHTALERYLFFRRVMNSTYEAINEYRRHVAMVFEMDSVESQINIDNISEYYEEMKEFLKYVEETYDLDIDND